MAGQTSGQATGKEIEGPGQPGAAPRGQGLLGIVHPDGEFMSPVTGHPARVALPTGHARAHHPAAAASIRVNQASKPEHSARMVWMPMSLAIGGPYRSLCRA